jgi:hypothetical protein
MWGMGLRFPRHWPRPICACTAGAAKKDVAKMDNRISFFMVPPHGCLIFCPSKILFSYRVRPQIKGKVNENFIINYFSKLTVERCRADILSNTWCGDLSSVLIHN